MKKLLFVVVSLALLPALALAQAATDSVTVAPSPSVVINIGAIVTALLSWSRDILVSVAGLVFSIFLPGYVRMFITNSMLSHAIDYGIAAVEGATKDKVITVPVANRVIEEASQYVIARAPSIAKRLGDDLKGSLLARLSEKAILPAKSVSNAMPDPAGSGSVSAG